MKRRRRVCIHPLSFCLPPFDESPAMRQQNRRTFLLSTAGAAVAASFSTSPTKAAPSERVALCIVGVRGRGRTVAANFARLPNAQITHMCDVNEPLLGPFGKQMADIQKSTPKP